MEFHAKILIPDKVYYVQGAWLRMSTCEEKRRRESHLALERRGKMSSLKTIQKLPHQELEIWEGGRIKMPSWITGERRGPYRPILEIWVEEHTGAIIIHNMERDLPVLQRSFAQGHDQADGRTGTPANPHPRD